MPIVKKPTSDEPLELDLQRFSEFYAGLRDGRTGDGARADQIERELRRVLGPCPSTKRDGELEFWMAPKGTIEGWLQRAAPGLAKRAVVRPAKVFHACYQIWDVDLTKAQCIANRFEVHVGAEDLLEVGRVSIERLPGSTRPYLVRFEKVCLTPTTRKIYDPNNTLIATASLGFFAISIVVELPGKAETKGTKVLVKFLSSSEPETQFGKVIGATIRWRHPDFEWQMIKPHNEQVNFGHLINATLLEFAANAGEKVKLSIVVRDEDFHPVVHLDAISGDANSDASKKNEYRQKLIAQVLKRRLDGKGRHALGSGTLVVK